MQIDELREQTARRDARRRLFRTTRRRLRNLVKLHARLRSGLDELLAQGDLWLLVHHSYPYVVLKHRPFFDDALELTDAGRRAIRIIGGELSGLSNVYSLITAHVDPRRGRAEQGCWGSDDAWLQARRVEAALIESGVNPSRVVSMGVVRCERDMDREVIEGLSPDSPFVTTICFTVMSKEITDASRRRANLD